MRGKFPNCSLTELYKQPVRSTDSLSLLVLKNVLKNHLANVSILYKLRDYISSFPVTLCISAIWGDFQPGWWTSHHTYHMHPKIIKIFIPSKPGTLCSQQLLPACLDSRNGTPWMSPSCSSGAETFSSPFCLTFLFSLWLRIRQNKLRFVIRSAAQNQTDYQNNHVSEQILDFSRKGA